MNAMSGGGASNSGMMGALLMSDSDAGEAMAIAGMLNGQQSGSAMNNALLYGAMGN